MDCPKLELVWLPTYQHTSSNRCILTVRNVKYGPSAEVTRGVDVTSPGPGIMTLQYTAVR